MNGFVKLGTVAVVLSTAASLANANDARSISLGGAVIANGKGVQGSISNPASMMQMHRLGETTHIHFGFSGEARANSDLVDTLTDSENENIFDELEDEIDNLNSQNIICNPITANDDTVCIANTDPISVLSDRILDILNIVDGETVDGRIQADLGMAFTQASIPFSINFSASATVATNSEVPDGDKVYIGQFVDILEGDLTFGEVENDEAPDYITFDETSGTVDVVLPDEDDPVTGEPVLNTNGEVSALVRSQLAISIARTLAVSGYKVDLGITPKFSSLEAYQTNTSIQDELDDNSQSTDDRFEDSKVTESSFTIDVGAVIDLPFAPVKVATVIRNLIPESISTNGFEFETTPQLIVGASHQRGKLGFTADLALNSAKVDNFETQKMGLGVEYGTRMYAVRAGISHDAARSDNATALSAGFSLGPLVIGARITNPESTEFGAQLAFSFK